MTNNFNFQPQEPPPLPPPVHTPTPARPTRLARPGDTIEPIGVPDEVREALRFTLSVNQESTKAALKLANRLIWRGRWRIVTCYRCQSTIEECRCPLSRDKKGNAT